MKFRHKILCKPLAGMSDSEQGVITKIRGSAAVHRFLLALGITVGTRIRRLVDSIDNLPDETLCLLISREKIHLGRELAGNIRVAVHRAYEDGPAGKPVTRHGTTAPVFLR